MKRSDKGKKVFGAIVILAIIVSVFGGVVSAVDLSGKGVTQSVTDVEIQTAVGNPDSEELAEALDAVTDDTVNIEFADQSLLLGPVSAASLTVPSFKQCDSRWGANQLGTCSDTICSAGCAVTSVAMILKYYGVATDPGDLNTWLTKNSGYASGCLIIWDKADDRSGGSVQYAGRYDSNIPNQVQREIDHGYPCVGGLDGHFVVITGYSDSLYYINDPSYSRSTISKSSITKIHTYHGTASGSCTAKFSKGDIVEVNTPGSCLKCYPDGPTSGTPKCKPHGTVGVILDPTPTLAADYCRVKVRYCDGFEGWSAQEYLEGKYIAPSTKFSIGDPVRARTGVKYRSDPPELNELGAVSQGTQGNILAGPKYGAVKEVSGCYWFWKIDYGGGKVGWSAQDYLEKVTPCPHSCWDRSALSGNELSALVRNHFPLGGVTQTGESIRVTAYAVAKAESGGNPSACGDIDIPAPGHMSIGLWQINTYWHPNYDRCRLFEEDYNANAAKAISNNGKDWNPWCTWEKSACGGNGNEAYKQYLTEARKHFYPKVTSLSVSQTSINLGEAVKIYYSVSDDVGLDRVELLRTTDKTGNPDEFNWKEVKRVSISGTTYSSYFDDSSHDSPGVYWYGIHVVDNSGAPEAWNDEKNSRTGGSPGVFGPIRVDVSLTQRTIDFYTDPTAGGRLTFDGSIYSNGQSTTKTDATYSVSANPASNYEFDHWSTTGSVGVANSYSQSTTATVSGDGTIKAWFNYIPPERTITFYTDPTAGGTLTFDGSIYSNGQSTTKTDATYSVSANPASNYAFDHWSTSSGVSVSNPNAQSTTATVSGDGTIKAWFNYITPQRTITFYTDPTAGGTLTFDGSIYSNGQSTTKTDATYSVSANPASNYAFDHWSTSSGVSVSNPNAQSTTATVSGDGTIKAWFNYITPQRTITFYTDPTAGGTLTFDGSIYSNGQSTTKTDATYSVSANPASNYEFDHWSTSSGVSVSNPNAQSTTATVSGDGTIKAWFNYITPQRTITFYTDPTAGGTLTFDGSIYSNGQSTTKTDATYSVSANPTSNHAFDHWSTSSGVSVSNPNAQSTTATVSGDGTIKAWFNYITPQRTITFYTDPTAGGTLTFDGSIYSNGQSTTKTDATYSVSATPASNYAFDHWSTSSGVSVSNPNAQSTTATVSGDGTIKAWFNYIPPERTITFYTDPDPTATITFDGSTYSNGQSTTKTDATYSVSANPTSNHAFDHWSTTGGVSVANPNSPSTTATVSGDGSIKAWFNYITPERLLDFYTDPTAGGRLTFDGSIYSNGQSTTKTDATYSVSANPASNYAFDHWSTTGGVGVSNPNSPSTTATVSGDGTIKAWFNYLPESSWTFMVYLDGDNDLEFAAIDDFLEMSSVGSTSDVNIVVQFDRIPGYDTSYGDWTDCKRFHVTYGMTPMPANALINLGECNMGDPNTLRDFVTWAMTDFPADNYALILWNHGDGWKSINNWVPWAADIKDAKDAGLSRGICVDITNSDYLTLQETEDALTGKYVDLLGYDACLMHMVEVVYQVMTNAGVSVGSEESEPGDGWPYDTILTDLTGTPTMTEDALGTVIVDRYMASYPTPNALTQSAMDNSALPNLVAAVDNLAQALMTEINGGHWTQVQQARNAAEEIYYNCYIDLYHFAEMVDTYVPGAAAEAQAVMNEVSGSMYEAHGTSVPNDHGLSIYFPRVEGDYLASYESTAFASATQWDEFLKRYYEGPELVCEGTATSCGIYPNCENCNEDDGCYVYDDGCEERDYYCISNEEGCGYTYSNRHTDGWEDTGNKKWVEVNECQEKEQKEQEYRDYYCSGGACTYSEGGTKWVDTGTTRNKDDGTICGCTASNTLKSCYSGVCSTDTGICDSANCGADAACDGKRPGDSCGGGRKCDSNCKCGVQVTREDIAVFRNGWWALKYGPVNNIPDFQPADKWLAYGAAGGTPVVGDFNNDGTDDIAIFQNGWWALKYGPVNAIADFQPADKWLAYGGAGTPVVGDFNNDGTDDIAIYQNGYWAIKYGSVNAIPNFSGADKWLAYGGAGIPVVGDFNDDGTVDIAMYQNGYWAIKYGPVNLIPNFSGADKWLAYGGAGTPIVGDFNDDGTVDIAMYQNGYWAIKYGPVNLIPNFSGADKWLAYGGAGTPVVGKFN